LTPPMERRSRSDQLAANFFLACTPVFDSQPLVATRDFVFFRQAPA
jgi:hypothetical protein